MDISSLPSVLVRMYLQNAVLSKPLKKKKYKAELKWNKYFQCAKVICVNEEGQLQHFVSGSAALF